MPYVHVNPIFVASVITGLLAKLRGASATNYMNAPSPTAENAELPYTLIAITFTQT